MEMSHLLELWQLGLTFLFIADYCDDKGISSDYNDTSKSWYEEQSIFIFIMKEMNSQLSKLKDNLLFSKK